VKAFIYKALKDIHLRLPGSSAIRRTTVDSFLQDEDSNCYIQTNTQYRGYKQ